MIIMFILMLIIVTLITVVIIRNKIVKSSVKSSGKSSVKGINKTSDPTSDPTCDSACQLCISECCSEPLCIITLQQCIDSCNLPNDIGSPCTPNTNGLNPYGNCGFCAYPHRGATQNVCSTEATSEQCLSENYNTNIPDGSPCWPECNVCKSGSSCRENSSGVNICQPKIADGSTCSAGDDCAGGACAYGFAGATNQVCCPSHAVDTYDGNQYCTDMAPGTPCWSNAMCGTNAICSGNDGGLEIGKCVVKLPNGSNCVHDDQCLKGACGYPHADDDGSEICCASGHTTEFGTYDYCTGMAKGTKCYSNDMCASGKCPGGSIFGTGTCT